MFAGHYGVSFAAKPAAREVPLWLWFIAVQWLDVVWSLLVLLGIEKLRIVPGFTEANPFEDTYVPYSHSLAGAVILSLVFGGAVAAFFRARRRRVFAWVTAAAFSHWLLDLVVHVPDLPLYGERYKMGFGLWRNVAVSFPLELVVLVAGAIVYAHATRPQGWMRIKFWAFVAFLIVAQWVGNFGPIPTSVPAMAGMGLAFYLAMAAVAAWVEREPRPIAPA